MKQKSSIFYGWRIVIALFFMWFGYAAQPFAVILKQLMVQFNAGRGEVSLILAISSITGGVSAFFVSRLLHRRSPRKFMLIGLSISGIAMLLCSLANSLWYLYIMYFFMGTFFGMSGAVVIIAILSRWFVRKRGQAVGLGLSGMSIGSIAIIPLVGWVAGKFGWRATYLMAGLLLLTIGIPIISLVVKDSPQEMGLLPDGDQGNYEGNNVPSLVTGSSLSSVSHHTGITAYLNRLPLWLIILGFPLATMGNVAILQHEFSFVTDIGIPSSLAASAFGFTMGLGGIGGFISGWLADRISPRYVSIMFLLMSIIGVLLLMRVSNRSSLWLFVVVFGLASSVPGIMLPLVIGDIFGSASLFVVFGFVNILFTFGFALGPPLAGFIFDATGSYSRVFLIVILFYIISAVTIYFTYGVKLRSWSRL